MEKPKEFKFKCTQCGKCCTEKNTLVNVTQPDIMRIKNGLNLSLDEILEILGFYVFEKKPTPEELKKMVVPPIETERGPSFVGLKKKPDGKCYFFNENENNCKIYNLRPMFCRTFPFSFRIIMDKKDKTRAKIELYYTDKGLIFCEGIGKEAPLINEDNWIQTGKKTIEDMNFNNIIIDKWNDAAKKGEITGTARNYLLTLINLDNKKE